MHHLHCLARAVFNNQNVKKQIKDKSLPEEQWVVNATGLVAKNSFQEYTIRIEKYSAILTQFKNKLLKVSLQGTRPATRLLLISLW